MFFFCQQAVSRSPYDFTDFELTMLPALCTYMKTGNKTAIEAKYGTMTNPHHLCKGLNHLNKATINVGMRKKERSNKQFDLIQAVNEFSYYIDYKRDTNMRMKYFTMMHRAKAFTMLGSNPDAKADYTTVLNANPKYTTAYKQLIKIHLQEGNKAEAKRIVNLGLEYMPESKYLLAQQKKLGN